MIFIFFFFTESLLTHNSPDPFSLTGKIIWDNTTDQVDHMEHILKISLE